MVKVFLYVIIFYRYFIEKNDGIESIEDNSEVVKEYVFVILDDVI